MFISHYFPSVPLFLLMSVSSFPTFFPFSSTVPSFPTFYVFPSVLLFFFSFPNFYFFQFLKFSSYLFLPFPFFSLFCFLNSTLIAFSLFYNSSLHCLLPLFHQFPCFLLFFFFNFGNNHTINRNVDCGDFCGVVVESVFLCVLPFTCVRCVHSNVWIRNLGSMCTSTNTHSYTHEHAHTSNGS